MQGRIIDVKNGLTEEDRAAWSDLATRAVEPNPFYEPECIVPAARHLASGDGIKLAVAEEDGRFFACLPIQHTRRHWLGKVEPSFQFVTTAVRRMNYMGTPLLDTSKALVAMRTLVDTVAQECLLAGSLMVEIGEVGTGGTVDAYLREAIAALGIPLNVVHTFDRGVLRREEMLDGVPLHSGKTLRNLRSKMRGMGRELEGEVTVEIRSDDEAIAEYIRIEESGYKAETGNAMTGTAGEPEQFTEMCRAFAAQGRFQLLSLMVGSTTTAMMGWVEAGNAIFQFKWSYDSRYAKYSPGLQIHLAAIERFQTATEATMLDTCTAPNNQFVSGMYRSRRSISRYQLLVDTGFRARASMTTVQGFTDALWKARSVRQKLKQRDDRQGNRADAGFRKAGS